MVVEICAVGGWGEIGRNMTAVRIDDSVVLFDMGLHMPNYIKLTEEEIGEWVKLNEPALKRANAVPQDGVIKDWRDKVVAIVISHGHLDHAGAAPYLAAKYDAPIICTPFTAAILRSICKDEKIKIPNKIVEYDAGSKITIADNLVLEFCNITHSTPQDVMAVLHTKYGCVIYANDFKLDDHPTLGRKPNYDHFKKLGDKGVLALISDCLYAPKESRTPCEAVAKEMLQDVLLGIDARGKAVIVTTFASHIARLKSIAEFGKRLGRKVVFMSRSIAKYCNAAEEAGVAYLSKEDVQIIKYGSQIRKKLKQVMAKGKDKFLLVVSGHQGEPKSALSRMAKKILPFRFSPGDVVVFAASVIPAEINQKNREVLEEKLKAFGVRLFKDVHVSGHAFKEDLREFIKMLKPKHVFPTHGEPRMVDAFAGLATELGYNEENIHKLTNGQRVSL